MEKILDNTLLTLRYNMDHNCLEVMRVIFTKGNPEGYRKYLAGKFILDKTQKIDQEAEMRAEPGKETSQDCLKDLN
jgi:hypothetical protein